MTSALLDLTVPSLDLSSPRRSSSPAHLTETIALTDSERQPCEVWTRVMGYHRPVSSFNAGKQSEHAERRFFRA